MPDPNSVTSVDRTPLNALHVERGARMAPFAGYDMPIHYPAGILAEHRWTRESAGLFDVSHMGQILLEGAGAGAAVETLVPADIRDLAPGRTRYTQFLDAKGGILDDLMITRLPARGGDERLLLVVNAARKEADVAHMAARLPHLRLARLDDRALVALQGPKAVAVAAARWPALAAMPFMSFAEAGDDVWAWRSGYTGEDGFEISLPGDRALATVEDLLADERVRPVGLGARDSLRLEAGLCLYGHDLDPTTSPVEAGLAWSIQKRRRLEGGFPGHARIARELADGPQRRRVGLALEGRQPAREGAEIADLEGRIVGRVTSGGFAPSLDRPIAMGYVAAGHSAPATALDLLVRGKPLPARIVDLPFVPHRYARTSA